MNKNVAFKTFDLKSLLDAKKIIKQYTANMDQL